ncbi:hypothetical protein BJ508DRAFT_342245 [Ascobolus immersus RN42]|uniref:Uncharacterized protein n=1 Tax=Ascobolus immersus RN42 TaxID=1160509 RepID=A0A3N4INQ8_ASCIM|nr:hypothetical protein BJ508DRAFT_342245 [Ascobolus immersus RN42]
MVKKHGFNIQVLDSDGDPLREYGYNGTANIEDNQNVDRSDVYLEVPKPDQDQTFSIRITRTRPSDDAEYSFKATFDGVESALESSIYPADKELYITEISLLDEHKTRYLKHTLQFAKLPPGPVDTNSDIFGTIELCFCRVVSLDGPVRINNLKATVDQFRSRKRPFSAIDPDSATSSNVATPSTISSGKRQKCLAHALVPSGAISHSVELAKYTSSLRPSELTQILRVGDAKFRIVFHYRNRNALRALNVLPQSSKEVSPMDGLALLSAIRKLEKLTSRESDSDKDDSDHEDSDDEVELDVYSDDEDDGLNSDDLCKRLRAMVDKLMD